LGLRGARGFFAAAVSIGLFSSLIVSSFPGLGCATCSGYDFD
jgi:hypothetical protein